MANIKSYKSPAKINLFLHILSKRDDGYHNLQTWFTFLDLADELTFEFNDSNNINITSSIKISSLEDNLVYKAIKLFQKEFNIVNIGVDISVEKNIPMGAGLGGGSSNAATTLIAMRDYYVPHISNEQMINLAARLGADVPIFLYGRSAWAEGIGEKLSYKAFNECYVLLVKPDIHISTKEFFESKDLQKQVILLDKDLPFDKTTMINAFEKVFSARYPEFCEYLRIMDNDFRMTGTGSCFYLLSQDKDKLEKVVRKIDKSLDKWMVKTLNYAY